MKKNLLVIYDLDLEYGNGLFSHLIHKDNSSFQIKLVTNYKSLEDIDEEITLLLLDEALSGVELSQKVKQVLYLSENVTDATHLNRYQSVDKIVEHIKSITSVNKEEVKNTFSKTQIIGVYSPVGGSGKTTVARKMASCISQNGGNAYYIDFGLIPERGDTSNADFFYDMHQGIHVEEDAWNKYFVEEEGVHWMYGSLYNNSLWDMKGEDVNFLLEEIQNRREGAFYIFDIGFMNKAIITLLAGCDSWVLPSLHGEGNERIQNMKALIDFQKKDSLSSKIVEITDLEQIESLCKKQVL